VSAALSAVLDRGANDLAAIAPDATAMTRVATSLVSGGKRFRARLAYWGWRAALTHGDLAAEPASDPGLAHVVTLATGLELFHAAALVHDDIIDNSDTRRGTPSAHRQFHAHHLENRYAGSGTFYGTASAILLGDLLLAWADDQFVSTALALPHDRAIDFAAELRTMRQDVTVGQFLDNHDTAAWGTIPLDSAIERAQRVVIYKSAKYSVEAPLALGAIIGGASPAFLSALRGFAVPLGFAFQLRDDVLGVFGDPSVTGKPAGDDLREGKRTVLLAIARERADRSTRDTLDELLGDPDLSGEQVAALCATLRSTGALDEVEALIVRSRDRAMTVLGQMGLDGATERELSVLAAALTERTV
jgi:geranylgeranyl diphosphate synthase type I